MCIISQHFLHAVLKAVIEEFEGTGWELVPVDYDELMEKTEAVEQTEMQAQHIVSHFRAKINEMFLEISGLNAEMWKNGF